MYAVPAHDTLSVQEFGYFIFTMYVVGLFVFWVGVGRNRSSVYAETGLITLKEVSCKHGKKLWVL